MSGIWLAVTLGSVAFALITGNADTAGNAVLASGNDALRTMLTLLASMTVWSGLMEILHASGAVAWMGRGFRWLCKPLFPKLKDDGCWEAMSLNMAANVLGLGNAATPAGIQAAKLLSLQGDSGIRALAMFLVMNSTGMQLIPTTVIALRHAAQSVDAAGVWLPTIIVSAFSMLVAILVMRVWGEGCRCRA